MVPIKPTTEVTTSVPLLNEVMNIAATKIKVNITILDENGPHPVPLYFISINIVITPNNNTAKPPKIERKCGALVLYISNKMSNIPYYYYPNSYKHIE
jgi:hypothetical protein